MYSIHIFSWGYFLKLILQQFQCTCILMQNVLEYCAFIIAVNLIFQGKKEMPCHLCKYNAYVLLDTGNQ